MATTLQMIRDKYAKVVAEQRYVTTQEVLVDILTVLAEMNDRDREHAEWIRRIDGRP